MGLAQRNQCICGEQHPDDSPGYWAWRRRELQVRLGEVMLERHKADAAYQRAMDTILNPDRDPDTRLPNIEHVKNLVAAAHEAFAAILGEIGHANDKCRYLDIDPSPLMEERPMPEHFTGPPPQFRLAADNLTQPAPVDASLAEGMTLRIVPEPVVSDGR